FRATLYRLFESLRFRERLRESGVSMIGVPIVRVELECLAQLRGGALVVLLAFEHCAPAAQDDPPVAGFRLLADRRGFLLALPRASRAPPPRLFESLRFRERPRESGVSMIGVPIVRVELECLAQLRRGALVILLPFEH